MSTMYRHCIFCSASLGSNEALEAFPVGRRLAFDAGKGRLWVVCRRCERWNLTPIESRWEAIEAAERQFRDTRARASTENIGLARLPEGTELIRIGRPQRPEFAAWRYGDQFGRRRRKFVLGFATVTTLGIGLVVGSFVLTGTSALMIPIYLYNLGRLARGRLGPGTTIFDTDGNRIQVPEKLYGVPQIRPSGNPEGWHLDLGAISESAPTLTGPAAVSALAVLMPKLNPEGGSAGQVRAAVRLIEEAGHPDAYFREVEPRARRAGFGFGTLAGLPDELRLATEMAAHEEHERAALEGELGSLERAWREAEEIAAIADNLFLPERVRAGFARLKRGSD